MATLRIRENDLFNSGLVLVSKGLASVIMEEAKKMIGEEKLRKINRKRLSSIYIGKITGPLQLSLFIRDILESEEDRNAFVARVHLDFPVIYGSDDTMIWTKLKADLNLPGFIDGGNKVFCLDVKLKGENRPIETRGFHGDSRKTFITLSEHIEQNKIEAAA